MRCNRYQLFSILLLQERVLAPQMDFICMSMGFREKKYTHVFLGEPIRNAMECFEDLIHFEHVGYTTGEDHR